MSDSQTTEDRTPRFTGSLLGRIIAVGLFLVLGTFAIYHLVTGDRAQANTLQTPDLLVQTPGLDGDDNSTPKLTSMGGNFDASKSPGLPDIKNKLSSTFPTKQPGAKGTTNDSFKVRPTSPVRTSTPKNKPIVTTVSSSTPIQSKTSFPGTNPARAMDQVRATKPVIPTIPKVTPRVAQLPGQIQNSVNNTANKLTQAANNAASNVANGASNFAGNLKQDTANAAQNLINQAGSTSRNIANQAKSSISGAFPGTSPAATPKVPPATSPLVNRSTPQNGFDTNSKMSPSNRGTASFDVSNGLRPTDINTNTNTTRNSIGQPAATPTVQRRQPMQPTAQTPPIRTNTQTQLGDGGFGGRPNAGARTNLQSARPPANSGFQSTGQQPTNSKAFGGSGFPTRQDGPTNRMQTPPNNSRAANSAPQIRRASSPLGAASMSLPGTGTNGAKSTPGDRTLEGVQAPSLTVEKLAPREIQLNQPADFEIVVRNVGRVIAEQIVVHDKVPAGTELVSTSPDPARGGGGTGDIRWSLGEIRPGQEKRIKMRLKPTRPGEIGSVAHVTFATQASMRTLVTKPVLQITQQSNPKVLIGDQVLLDVLVENKGDGPAVDVMVEEKVPSQLESKWGDEIEYPIGTLAPGQSKRIQLPLRAAQKGRLKNIILASASGGLKAQHAIDMEVVGPQLQTTGEGPAIRFLNREATHNFSVVNRGTAAATNVELIARLPSGLRFVSANHRGKYDANSHAVYWSLAELDPATRPAAVELKTIPVETGNQPIKFEAMADLNQQSETTADMVVNHLIDVFFDIDDVVDPIEVGSGTAYRIRVVNQGTKMASNVQLKVDFPGGIQPTTVDGNLPHEVRGQSVVFAPIANMNPGDEIKIVVNGKGVSEGDHRVAVRLQADGRQANVSKEETTRVYADR